MNYDERMAYLKDWFKSDIITRFAMPRDLEPKMVAMDVIDTINANIPSGVNEQRMASTYANDPFALTAKTVLSGGAISDTYLSGHSRDKLINEYGITDADLAPYDKYISTRNA